MPQTKVSFRSVSKMENVWLCSAGSGPRGAVPNSPCDFSTKFVDGIMKDPEEVILKKNLVLYLCREVQFCVLGSAVFPFQTCREVQFHVPGSAVENPLPSR